MGLFTEQDVWAGGFYELALEYRVGASIGVIEAARTVWRLDMLEGCYLRADCDPPDQPRIEFDAQLLSSGHLYGVATLPNGTRVACGTYSILELDGSDWLVLYCTMSALDRAYPVGGFPFDQADHEGWRRPLDEWFAEIGRKVFARAPFLLGVVGFELDLHVLAPAVASSGVPVNRYDGILLPTHAGLEWHPRTE